MVKPSKKRREGTPNVVARFAVIQAQRALEEVSGYLANPRGQDQGRTFQDLKDQVSEIAKAVDEIVEMAVIPQKWDAVVPVEVCDVLDRVETVVSLVHVQTFMQDSGVYADGLAQEVGSLSRRVRGATPGERILF